MVCARKSLIHAGLLDTMVTQSYLDNLIETCPQITRNAVALRGTWVRIPPLPSQKVLEIIRRLDILANVKLAIKKKALKGFNRVKEVDPLNPFIFFDYSSYSKKYTYFIDFEFIYWYNTISI